MEGLSFSSSSFRSMKDLYKEINETRRERQRETSRRFQYEEYPNTYFQQQRRPKKKRASHYSTRSTFFEKEDWFEYDEGLGHETLSEYLSEYKSQPRALKENLSLQQFLQLKEERRSISSNRRKRHRFFLPTFDGSSTSNLRAWRE